MSGHCDFCGVWHSGSCCHPGRAQLEQIRAERDRISELHAESQAEIDRLRAERDAALELRQKGCDCNDEDACRYARERDAARELLLECEKHLRHNRWCQLYEPHTELQCTCGVNELKRAIETLCKAQEGGK